MSDDEEDELIDNGGSGGEETEDDEDDEENDGVGTSVKMESHPISTNTKSQIYRIVAPDSRITSNILLKTEMAQVLAVRAAQISAHGIQINEESGVVDHDPCVIAEKELRARRCPLLLRRTIGTDRDGARVIEEWDVNKMTHV
jgi:DNA-directed RNA polymerase subunit K/omega